MKRNIELESGKLLGYRITTSRGHDSVNTKQVGNTAPDTKLGAKIGGKPPIIDISVNIGQSGPT